MRKIGYHTSVTKGWVRAMEEVKNIGGGSFQFFTRNPRGSRAKAVDHEDLAEFQKLRGDFGPVIAHGAYTMNLASSKEEVRERSVDLIGDDMERLAAFPEDTVYVFHPGSHTGDGVEKGIERIIRGLDAVKEKIPHGKICLETMSGKGSEVGSRLEELQAIIEGVGDDNLGILLDTCHMFSAGYDLSNPEEVLNRIEDTVGLHKVHGLHLNDSMMPFGAKKDRHAPIGGGEIGLDVIANFIGEDVFKDLPMALETPGGVENYEREIETLQSALSSR